MRIADLSPSTEIASVNIDALNPRFPPSDLPFYRRLGRTDLTVSCLGLGGGGGISPEDTLYAFDRGINYFFYSSDLHHFIYRSMAPALQELCGRGSSIRERVVLATVTYIKNPEVALSALFDQFAELGIDYIDILFWGWIGTRDASAFADCLDLSHDLRGPDTVYRRTLEKMIGTSERMKKMGIVRYIGASFHDLDLAARWLDSPLLDVIMIRHNVSHRSAREKIFHRLDRRDPQRPGISTFKSTVGRGGILSEAPAGLPEGCWIPSVPDLYRYSLSRDPVDVCLTGTRRREEIDAAIAGVQRGKLTADELAYLDLYGDLHRGRIEIGAIPPEKLIYRT